MAGCLAPAKPSLDYLLSTSSLLLGVSNEMRGSVSPGMPLLRWPCPVVSQV